MKFAQDAKNQIDQWILHRIRTDKIPKNGQLGNYYNVAE